MIKKAVMLVCVMVLSFGTVFATTTNSIGETTVNDTYAMITGSVVDSNTGEAIPNATIAITGTEQTATTDENGAFSFEEIETGEYTLSVEVEGYQKTEKTVNVTEEGTNVEVMVTPEM